MIIFIRTKDSHWVGASLEHSVPEAIDFATQYGHDIKMVAEKVYHIRKKSIPSDTKYQTDRPKTEYWNSGNIELRRLLCCQYGLWWVHFTGQSHHNKVSYTKHQYVLLKVFLIMLGLG